MKLLKKIFLSVLAGLIVMISFNCGKDYSFERSQFIKDYGSWTFIQGDTAYTGRFDTAIYIKGVLNNELQLIGHNNQIPGDSVHISIFTSDSIVQPGTYNASDFASTFDYGAQSPFLFHSSQLIGDYSLIVTTVNNNLMEGTFSGSVLGKDGNLTPIQKGTFFANLQGVM